MQEQQPILIVDDDNAIRYIISHVLRTVGYQVEQATNGHEALETVARRKPCLILLDITMPVMGGIETFQRLRAGPATAGIPVIMLTAMTQYLTSAERSVAESADAFMDKKFSIDRLITTVQQLLQTDDRIGGAQQRAAQA